MKWDQLAKGLSMAICGMGLLVSQAAISQEKGKDLAEMTSEDRHRLIEEMQRALDESLAGMQFFEEDSLPINARVSMVDIDHTVVVDLDERLGPNAYTSEGEDLVRHVSNTLSPFIEMHGAAAVMTFLYGGYEPSHWPENVPAEARLSSRRKRSADAPPLLVISPGHGLYFHGKYKDWRAQREPANGLLEDDITPVLAGHLEYAVRRDGERVENIRNESSILAHEPSGQPWWRVSARYHFEANYPDLSQVWRSGPDRKNALQERDEDIRSRPLYANHVKARALIHIHTNAHKSPLTNGMRVYIRKKSEDRALAVRILCSSRELVGTNEKFSAFSVAGHPNEEGDYGENRLAEMPSVIVEVGFHTNAQDAAFLKDRTFQALAMRGVAKGYRLYRNKLPCEEFAINPGDEVAGRVGVDVQLPFSFKGNPVYPIRVWSRDEKCTYRGCHNVDKTLSGPSDLEKFKLKYLCKREDLQRPPIELTVGAKDFDGVRAAPATLKVSCKAG